MSLTNWTVKGTAWEWGSIMHCWKRFGVWVWENGLQECLMKQQREGFSLNFFVIINLFGLWMCTGTKKVIFSNNWFQSIFFQFWYLSFFQDVGRWGIYSNISLAQQNVWDVYDGRGSSSTCYCCRSVSNFFSELHNFRSTFCPCSIVNSQTWVLSAALLVFSIVGWKTMDGFPPVHISICVRYKWTKTKVGPRAVERLGLRQC